MPIEREDLNNFAEDLSEKLQDKLTIAMLPLVSRVENLDKALSQHQAHHEGEDGLDKKIERNSNALRRIFWTGSGAFGLLTIWEVVKAMTTSLRNGGKP